MRRAALAVALLVVFALAGTSAASAPRQVRNGRIVFVGPGGSLPPQPTLLAVDADGSGLRIVAQEGDPEVGVSPLHPTWSPDGTHLAFEAHFFHDFRRPDGNYLPRDDELRVVDLATGSIRRLTDYSRRLDWNRGFSDTSPAWSPDGRL